MLQIGVNGAVSGLEIAVLAAAFQIAYLPSRVFFLGLAGIYVAAPYIYRSLLTAGTGLFVAAVGTAVVSGLASIILERFNHAPLNRRRAPSAAHMISSLGIYIVLTQLVVLGFGDGAATVDQVTVPVGWTRGLLTGAQGVSLFAACGLLLGYAFLLEFTPLGQRLRTLAANPRQFELYGYDPSRFMLTAFGVSGALAAAAALLRANDTGFDPYVGLPTLLLAVVAAIVGGRNSFMAPIAGALILGLARAAAAWIWDARWQDVVTFLALGLVLLVRPSGLLAPRVRLESA